MATYQLRIYTINRGMMDSWLSVFNEHIRPLHDRLGIPVVSSYVNADRTEFIWVRRLPGAHRPGRPTHQPYRQDGSPRHGRRGGGRWRGLADPVIARSVTPLSLRAKRYPIVCHCERSVAISLMSLRLRDCRVATLPATTPEAHQRTPTGRYAPASRH